MNFPWSRGSFQLHARFLRVSSGPSRGGTRTRDREHLPVFHTRGPTIAKDARALAAPGRSTTPGRVRGPLLEVVDGFRGVVARVRETTRGG